jgi:hypothetical protein
MKLIVRGKHVHLAFGQGDSSDQIGERLPNVIAIVVQILGLYCHATVKLRPVNDA